MAHKISLHKYSRTKIIAHNVTKEQESWLNDAYKSHISWGSHNGLML